MRTVSGSRPADGADAELDAMTGDSRADGSRGRRTREYTYTTFRPVWNAAQCENIAPVEDDDADAPRSDRRIAAGEAYLAGTPAKVDIARRDDACYRTRNDEILLPRREQFDDVVGFYQTALHELAHATGHESRLNPRLDENRFGSAHTSARNSWPRCRRSWRARTPTSGTAREYSLLGIDHAHDSKTVQSLALPIYIVGPGGRRATPRHDAQRSSC